MNQRSALFIAGILGMLAVMLGAFGAHALKPTLEATGSVDIYKLANEYQYFHTLAIFGTAILMGQYTSKWLQYAVLFFVLGIVFFCGSLYGLSFSRLSFLGPITPLGGVMFILGWFFLILGVAKK